MIRLRSWIYLFAFLAWTLFCCLLCLPLVVSQKTTLAGVKIWVRGIMVLARVIVGITCRVEGREHVPDGPCIIAAQHQASFETYRLFLDVRHPVFILKRELSWIPFIGWYMYRIGLVPIDRAAGAAAMRKVLRAAQKSLGQGKQVVIFPEGTRLPAGVRRPYQPGVAALYAHCDAPMIPLALNSGHTWGKTRLLKIPGEIVFRFLPPLPRGMDRDTMLAELQRRLEAAAETLPNNKPYPKP